MFQVISRFKTPNHSFSHKKDRRKEETKCLQIICQFALVFVNALKFFIILIRGFSFFLTNYLGTMLFLLLGTPSNSKTMPFRKYKVYLRFALLYLILFYKIVEYLRKVSQASLD